MSPRTLERVLRRALRDGRMSLVDAACAAIVARRWMLADRALAWWALDQAGRVRRERPDVGPSHAQYMAWARAIGGR